MSSRPAQAGNISLVKCLLPCIQFSVSASPKKVFWCLKRLWNYFILSEKTPISHLWESYHKTCRGLWRFLMQNRSNSDYMERPNCCHPNCCTKGKAHSGFKPTQVQTGWALLRSKHWSQASVVLSSLLWFVSDPALGWSCPKRGRLSQLS
jgi:hypothetical protein